MRRELKRPQHAVFLLLFGCLLALLVWGSSLTSYADSADYDTNEFNVKATVSEDHVIHMEETIVVDFKQSEHHGIMRYIPRSSKYYTIRHMKTPGVENSHEIESYYGSNGSLVSYDVYYLGSSNYTVSGKKTYQLNYDIVCYEDSSTEGDNLSLDLLPTGWQTPIGSTKLSLTMPKDFDWSALKIYSGAYGSQGLSAAFEKSTSGNTLTITGKDLPIYTGVTVETDLPEGYWVNPANGDHFRVILYVVLLLIPLLLFLLWFAFGRDPRVVRTVEFYAPEGLTPAEIGYIVDGKVDSRDLASMFMYYGSKGYLKLEEIERGVIEVTKLTDIDKSEKGFVKTLFRDIFQSGTTVRLDEMPEEFGQDLMTVKEKILSYYAKKDQKLFRTSADVARIFGIVLMALPGVAAILFPLLEVRETLPIFWGIPILLLQVIGMVSLLSAFDRIRSRARSNNVLLFGFGLAFLFAGSVLAAAINYMILHSILAAVLVIASVLLTFLFVLLMRARTEQGAKWMGQILGFRHFIHDAEYERLKALSDEDPEYFFNVMPYAYVMGMDATWAKKFDKIKVQQPSWYSSYDSTNMMRPLWYSSMLNTCGASVGHNFSQAMIDAAGGELGDFGGDFGGGGFSGGGFGGGGGGAW